MMRMNWKMKRKVKDELYKIILTEEQLKLIAECVEDCHRFASGQTDMANMLKRIGLLKHREALRLVNKGFITPFLKDGEYIPFDGSRLDGAHKEYVAKTYPLYREIYHRLAQIHGDDSVYSSETLLCENSGRLIEVEKVEEKC